MIRRATAGDVGAILPLFERLLESGPWCKLFAMDDASVARGLRAFCAGEDSAVFLVERGGEIKGVFALVIAPVWFSLGHRFAQELLWQVDPDAAMAAPSLLRAGERWARDKGALYSAMGRFANLPQEQARFYEAAGYNSTEIVYVKAL